MQSNVPPGRGAPRAPAARSRDAACAGAWLGCAAARAARLLPARVRVHQVGHGGHQLGQLQPGAREALQQRRGEGAARAADSSSSNAAGSEGGRVGAREALQQRRGEGAARGQTEQRAAELGRLDRAIDVVRLELANLGEQLPVDAPPEAQALLQIHAMMLEDPSLVEQTRLAVELHGQNAEWAFFAQVEHLAAQFEQFEDAYLRERGRDLTQVADRVLKALSGSGRRLPERPKPGDVPLVFIAHDVAPADMLHLKQAGGFALDLGGTASHTAILARSMNVPAVVGLNTGSLLVRDDDWVVLDGDAGVLMVAPDAIVLEEYRHRMMLGLLERKQLERLVHVPTATVDRVPIELHANIELPAEAEQAIEAGAAGIGLFRTEFMFMNRDDRPGEDEQYEAYAARAR